MTHKVKVGNIYIGGGAPVTVQTMLDKPSYDIEGNVKQALEVEEAGCDILRIAVPDEGAIATFEAVKKAISIPLVADIHYDYRLAIKAVDCGADKIRINPGNIGGAEKVKIVTDKCKSNGTAIRIGVNAGSLERDILAKYGAATPQALCESAIAGVNLLESFGFKNTVVSIKTSSVVDTVEAYRIFREKSDYPLHIGVTESGTMETGTVRSSVALGSLLLSGIGETLRVSLSDEPVNEVKVGLDILKACGLRTGVQVVSCPTCGRTRINVKELAKRVEKMVAKHELPLKIAVMGCVVNGPGEARDADLGITGGNGVGLIFKKGNVLEKVAEEELLPTFEKYIKELIGSK